MARRIRNTPAKTAPTEPTQTRAETYAHPEARSVLRPDVGTQAQFRKKKPPVRYRYDSSLSPALDWDGQNPARERSEVLIRRVLEAGSLGEAKAAALELKALGRPFLDWAGKAERSSFDVPTLPLFVHERLSTKAILETLKGHKRDRQIDMFSLFNDARRSIHDQVLRAYEHPDRWVNRLVLGDSLVVMNSLLHYENLGGQVQTIYMDPPYQVNFGSNFQPFVRKRDVTHNDDDDMTREPEMVRAYRDTWELGAHSYLTYLRDRLLLCRELLSPSGSIFVQISDQNVHHVREVMDEVFGVEANVVTILIKKKGSQRSGLVDPVNDYLLWYSKTPRGAGATGPKFHPFFLERDLDDETLDEFRWVELADGSRHSLRAMPAPDGEVVDYRTQVRRLFEDYPDARLFRPWPVTNGGIRANQMDPIELGGGTYLPPPGRCWSHSSRSNDASIPGMEKLKRGGRLMASGKSLDFIRYLRDFPFKALANWWDALGGAANPIYVVQTNPEIVKRCILMTTDPGDLVLDPTCGSGTTAYVAEQWGRRWITVDTSRVPLALARQRLLTATFPWYELKDERRGPVGGFVYERKLNKKGEDVGGIVPHVTSASIANDEPPREELIADRPAELGAITRVTGPFSLEATIPTPADWLDDGTEKGTGGPEHHGSFVDRMVEVLRRSPVLHVGGGRKVELRHVRKPAKTLSLSAEAQVVNGTNGTKPEGATESRSGSLDPGGDVVAEPRRGEPSDRDPGKPVAIVFGPENGAVSEKLVFEAAREAYGKSYTHLYVIGFAIQPNARELVERCERVVGVAATYVQATPDLMMGDLLKNMRSSQIFSVCGLPEVRILRAAASADRPATVQVELVGLDVFDPTTMDVDHQEGTNVPAWFLDTDYNGLCFHVCQAFFPRTAAWDDLKRSLKGEFEDSVWDHLAGTVSAPFEPGEHGEIAVKVIDDRGNELLVVKSLKDPTP